MVLLLVVKKLCIEEAMNLIKNDLKKLGIVHDNFVSENYIVNQNLVEKALDILKKKNNSPPQTYYKALQATYSSQHVMLSIQGE